MGKVSYILGEETAKDAKYTPGTSNGSYGSNGPIWLKGSGFILERDDRGWKVEVGWHETGNHKGNSQKHIFGPICCHLGAPSNSIYILYVYVSINCVCVYIYIYNLEIFSKYIHICMHTHTQCIIVHILCTESYILSRLYIRL